MDKLRKVQTVIFSRLVVGPTEPGIMLSGGNKPIIIDTDGDIVEPVYDVETVDGMDVVVENMLDDIRAGYC